MKCHVLSTPAYILIHSFLLWEKTSEGKWEFYVFWSSFPALPYTDRIPIQSPSAWRDTLFQFNQSNLGRSNNVSVLSQGEQSLELNTLLHRSLAFCRSLFFFNRTNRHLNTSMMLSIDFCRVVVRLSVILWPRLFDSHLPNNLNKYI